MKSIVRACVAALLLTGIVTQRAAAIVHFDAKRQKALTHSVVHVMCPDKNRSGTGFIYRRSDWVITALHVVAGCNSIEVRSDVFVREEDASIQRVFKQGDLALLRLPQTNSHTPPLAVSVAAGAFPVTELLLIGYDGDLSVPGTQLLVSKCCRYTLRQILTNAEGSALTSPSATAPIIELDGALVRGHSGAPIFNQEGKVVAVGDGGLSTVGNISTSWAIPARLFRALEVSHDNKNDPQLEQSSQILFASEMQPNDDTPFSSLAGTVIIVGPEGAGTSVSLPAVFQNHTLFVAVTRNDVILGEAKTLIGMLGASITYNSSFHLLDFAKPGSDESLQVGTNSVEINGETRPLQIAPFTYKNYVMVNLQLVANALGADGPYAQTTSEPAEWRLFYTPPTPTPAPTSALPPAPVAATRAPSPLPTPTPTSPSTPIAYPEPSSTSTPRH